MAREIIVFRKVLKAGAIFAGGVEEGRGKKGLSNGPKPSGTYRHFVVHLDENRRAIAL